MSIATKCVCGKSIGGYCNPSIEECRMFFKEQPQQYVWVVTQPENGWDCIIGVYSSYRKVIEQYYEFVYDAELGDDITKYEGYEHNGEIIHKQILN